MRKLAATFMLTTVIAAACRAPEAQIGGLPAPRPTTSLLAIWSPTSLTHGDLTYSAQALADAAQPELIRLHAAIHNESDVPVQLSFPDGCFVLIRAYRSADRTQPPAWDQARTAACTQVVAQHRLDPGFVLSFDEAVTDAGILGDSLPAGAYHLSVLVRPDNRSVEIPAGMVVLGH